MAVHFFHCTNGIDLVIDETGHDTKTSDEISSHAHSVAARLMGACPGYDEWSNWTVHVYDTVGAVAIVDFPAARRQAA